MTENCIFPLPASALSYIDGVTLDRAASANSDDPVFPTTLSSGIHPLAQIAASDLQQRPLFSGERTAARAEGKMFGVLVVRYKSKSSCQCEFGYLAAFSGKLDGHWTCNGFVPPPFDVREVSLFIDEGDTQIRRLEEQIEAIRRSEKKKLLEGQLEKLESDYAGASKSRAQRLRQRKIQRHSERRDLALTVSTDTDHHNTVLAALAVLAKQSSDDKKEKKDARRQYEIRRKSISGQLREFESKLELLVEQRKLLSADLQARYFSFFNLVDAAGEPLLLKNLYVDKLPAAGTGECAAPKLLAYADKQGYEPIAGTEFWWGPSPTGKVMHHASFYAPCHSKCGELLPKMLGHRNPVHTDPTVRKEDARRKLADYAHGDFEAAGIEVLYSDSDIAAVSKPAGLLSVPGTTDRVSLYDLARLEWRHAQGPLLVHRLDMDTSGILLIAFNASAYKGLQRQFESRQIRKRYVALVHGSVTGTVGRDNGVISLPLRVDADDRPRQMVCESNGKSATTHWQMIEENTGKSGVISQLQVEPVSGRTHQIRVHLASPLGLGMPIVGDRLYTPNNGKADSSSRMMLHAASVDFTHPITGKPMTLDSAVPFTLNHACE